MLIFIFWVSIFMVFYVYIGYPSLIMILSLFSKQEIDVKEIMPSITILIAAYNEAEYIQTTVKNKLELEYPPDRLEIIVISDGSNDNTDELVKAFNADNVRLIRQNPRAGKTAALNLAVPHAKGEILVFSDANSIYDPLAIKKLVANFNDETIGYVTGKMIYVNPDGSLIGDGCSAYMKYENVLRTFETKVGSVIGVDGGIDAVRRVLYEPMRNDQLPDFVLPLKVAGKGYRVVYEPKALLKEDALNTVSDEYRMRVRVALRAIWALYDMRELLSYKQNYVLISWQLWSHKVLRYGCFIFILAAYLSNTVLLLNGSFYIFTFILQTAVYGSSLLSRFLPKHGVVGKLLNFSRYFILLNMASAHAAFKFLMRKKQIVWNPRIG